MQRIEVPPNTIIERPGRRKVLFATKKANALLRLSSLMREERMIVRALRKEMQQTQGNFGVEVEKIEDAMRLGVLLLARLATEENAQLESMSSTEFAEVQARVAKRKHETVEALRTSAIGLLSSINTTANERKSHSSS